MKPRRSISTQEADLRSAPYIHLPPAPHFDIWDEDRVQRFHVWLEDFEGYVQALGKLDDVRKKAFVLMLNKAWLSDNTSALFIARALTLHHIYTMTIDCITRKVAN